MRIVNTRGMADEIVLGEDVIDMVQRRAAEAHKKHGEGSILHGKRDGAYVLACGMEELGEVARAMVESQGIDRVIDEWIDVANVALSAVEVLLRDYRGRP